MVRSLWVTPLAVVLAAACLARGQASPYVHTATGEVKEQFVTVQELSKPGQKCKLLKTWFQADGAKAYLVQSVETGEKMTIVESGAVTAGPGSSLGAKFRAVSTRIFHWGPGREPPTDTPLPPDDATVLGRPVDPAAKPAAVAAKPTRAKATAKAPSRDAPTPPAAQATAPAPTPKPAQAVASAAQASPYSPAATRWSTTPTAPAAPPGGLTTLVPSDFRMAKPAPADPPAPKSGAIAALASSKDPAPGPDWHKSWVRADVTKTMPAGRAEMPAPGSEVFPTPAPTAAAKPVVKQPTVVQNQKLVAQKQPSLPHAKPAAADPLTDPARYARADDAQAPKHWFNRTKGITPPGQPPAEAVASSPQSSKAVRPVVAEKPTSPYAGGTLSAAVSVPAAPPAPNPLPKLTDPVPPAVTTTATPPAPTAVAVKKPAPPPPVVLKTTPTAAAKVTSPPASAGLDAQPGTRSILAAKAPEVVGAAPRDVPAMGLNADDGNAFSPPRRPAPRAAAAGSTAVPPFAAPVPPAEVANAFTTEAAPPAPPPPQYANAFVNPGMMAQPPAAAPASYPVAQAAGGTWQLLAVLRDDLHPSNREWAADCLTTCDWRRQPEVVEGLATAARSDPAPLVRAGCVRALARMKAATEPAVAAVQALQTDADDHVRQAALQALPVLTAVRPVGAVMPR